MDNKLLILKEMIKEEARMHTTLYGGVSFYYFPFMIFLLSSFVSFVFFSIKGDINTEMFVIISAIIFFLMGLMNGAFGIYAKDYLERRFGDIGKVFSNLVLLPISLKTIFTLTIIKDVIFYMIWLVLPIYLGYTFAALINGFEFVYLLVLFFVIFSIFIYGVLTAFLLSVLYEKYILSFIGLLVLVISYVFYVLVYEVSYEFLILPFLFLEDPNFITALLIILSIIIISVLIALIIGDEFVTRKKEERVKSSDIFRVNSFDLFILKDYLDLKRTGGLFAKPFFTMVLPSLLLLLLFTSTPYFSIADRDILLFSVLLGTLSVALFNSMLSSDSFAYYRFLPVDISDYIRGKIKMTLFLGILYGSIILVVFGLYNETIYLLFHAFLIYFIFMIYNLALTFYFAGLNPQEYLLNTYIFVKYALALLPVLFLGMFSAVFIDLLLFYAISAFIFSFLSYLLLRKGFDKWRYSEEIK